MTMVLDTSARNRSAAHLSGVRVWSAAVLTIGAGLIHLTVAPEHLREWAPFGAFFLVAGSCQIILTAELIARPARKLVASILTFNVFLIALWYVSRTSGLPIGPTPGQTEAVGPTDVAAKALEILGSAILLSLCVWPDHRRARRAWMVGSGTLPSALVTVALTVAAIAAALHDMPEAVNAAPAAEGQAAISITSLIETPGSQPVKHFVLNAAPIDLNGQTYYALNGTVPGPTLRVNQGDRIQVTLINHLPESTTLHWHGVVVPNAEDGVAGVTQDAVAPGAEYTYEFVARETGTYWYHSHQLTSEQLPKGLFGALIVLPATGQVEQQRDYTVLLHGTEGRVAINGQTGDLHLEADPGDTVRLRVINAVAPGMDGGPEAPVLVGAPYRVVALDGRDLSAPDVLGPERIALGMGQRADLVFTMPANGSVRLIDTEVTGETSIVQNFFTGDVQPILGSVTIGDGPALDEDDVSTATLFDPLHYGVTAHDPVASVEADQTVSMVLGKQPGIRDGRPQLIHMINGHASPEVPPIIVMEGQIVRLHIVNTTAEYHPMHLHGHVFSVLAVDGEQAEGSPLHLDSVLVGPNQTVDVAFAANNPGVWMFHCHVLLHAEMGMTISVNYAGYSTPFEMGTRSGNMPE